MARPMIILGELTLMIRHGSGLTLEIRDHIEMHLHAPLYPRAQMLRVLNDHLQFLQQSGTVSVQLLMSAERENYERAVRN